MNEFTIPEMLLNQDRPAIEYRKIHSDILNDLILQGKQKWQSRRTIDAIALDWHLRHWLEAQRCEFKLEIQIGWAEFRHWPGIVTEGYESQVILSLAGPYALLFKLTWGGGK